RAATFFIEQILFAPDADSYRVLGAEPQASPAELRRNLALLLRWLHPDLDPRGERSVFIGRVTAAWNNLKTPEKRAAYDELRRLTNGRSRSRTSRRGYRKKFAGPIPDRYMSDRYVAAQYAMYRGSKLGFFRRALSALFHRTPQ